MQNIKLECEPVSHEVWEITEYKFKKSPTLARCDFEKMARVCVGWDEDVEMEIEFFYICNDSICLVTVKERIE